MDKYQYQPIKSPDQIRLLELLPGKGVDLIQIKLSHHPLADLPRCEALSYEWGSPTRDHEINCEGKSLELQELNHSTSPGRIFQTATEMLIRELPSFRYLFFHKLVTKSLEEVDTPSWVLWMDNEPFRIVLGNMPDYKIRGPNGVAVAGSTMQASGFVLDLVTDVTDNLSPEKLGGLVLRCYDDWIKASVEDDEDHASSIELLWQLITLLDKTPTGDEFSDFVTWVARLKVRSGAYTIDEVTAIANVGRTGKHRFNDVEIVDLIKEVSNDGASFFEPVCEGILYKSDIFQGRNLFGTLLGYCGVGPAGDSSPGSKSPAVQVGDVVTLLATSPAPIILRKIGEEYYRLVGMAHIPHITTDPEFQKGFAEGFATNFQKFLIR